MSTIIGFIVSIFLVVFSLILQQRKPLN
jgi:hypothetical protein